VEAGHGEAEAPRVAAHLVQREQPPVTAKGVEDTAFYRYGRLLALNEVGGDPGRFGLSVAAFHAASAERAARFPRGLLVSSTHDTKRSGDVRARLAALSWMPERWAERLRAWFQLTEELVEDGAPDGAERVMLLQNLLGAWPLDEGRLRGFVEKALREAKVHTTWAEPDEGWEGRVQRFAAALLEHRPFLEDFVPFAKEVAREGERVALGMTLLKLCVPGTTDVYGGDELWFLGLVDPDNRRPVDWDARRDALAALRAGAEPTRETQKLYLLWRGLELRARREAAFAGPYAPLEAGDGICAFLRGEGEVLAVVPVRPGAATGGAAVEGVPAGRWRDVLGGEERGLDGAPVGVAGLVERFGVGLLERLG
jgi:(1->4)-alpha-D-glucan 1-alpha-D-glucosylmutase